MNMMPGGEAADPAAMMKAMQSMQQSWLAAATGGTSGGDSGQAMAEGIEQIDKRITDLQAVEQWLTMNLSMLRSTVQGLQMQRAALSSMEQMQQTWQAGMSSAANTESTSDQDGPSGDGPTNPMPGMIDPTPFWNLLQQQFETIARSAVAASPNNTATEGDKPPGEPTGDSKGDKP